MLGVHRLCRFWSGVDLTGNQTGVWLNPQQDPFWSGVDLTGNQTWEKILDATCPFWSGVDLTGNQTPMERHRDNRRFGAVSI